MDQSVSQSINQSITIFTTLFYNDVWSYTGPGSLKSNGKQTFSPINRGGSRKFQWGGGMQKLSLRIKLVAPWLPHTVRTVRPLVSAKIRGGGQLGVPLLNLPLIVAVVYYNFINVLMFLFFFHSFSCSITWLVDNSTNVATGKKLNHNYFCVNL